MEKGAGSSKKIGKWSKEQNKLSGSKWKIKKAQAAKRDERGAVKISKKEQAPKNGREQGDMMG